MRFFLRAFLPLLISLSIAFFSSLSHAAETQAQDTGQVLGQIVSTHDEVVPGQAFYVGLYTILDPKWHTYWLNPGDSGEPVDIEFNPVDGLNFGDIVWPLPAPALTGPIVNYGFEGAPMFPVPVTVSDSALAGQTLRVEGTARYLVCYDICIPESFTFSMPIKVSAAPVIDDRWSRNIKRALNSAPKQMPAALYAASARLENGRLLIDVSSDSFTSGSVRNPYIYPVDPGTTIHSNAQMSTVGENGVSVSLSAGFNLNEAINAPLELLLGYDVKTDAGWKPTGQFITASAGQALDIGAKTSSGSQGLSTGGFTLLTALISAFLGGLILNFMPCVFPVISIKALSFAKLAHEDRAIIRRQSWIYTAGVFATFGVLTAALLLVKAGGAQVGWGFHLQSPLIVGALALLVFAIGLNLMGLFEIGETVTNVGGDFATQGGGRGAFFTGVLAVIVATPCTAPFMAGAIGYAFVQSTLVTLLIFAGLAAGFAAPFLALSHAPALLKRLPKPGSWMVRFKELLAFPMFAATAWLIWVVSLQVGPMGTFKLLLAMVGIGLVIWLLARKNLFSKLLAIAVLLGVLAAPLSLKASGSAAIADTVHTISQPWSTERVLELQNENRAVFVDFTAAWCVTCKVNEMTSLKSAKVLKAFESTNTAFLVADWTQKDDRIAQELAVYGRSGIPLYLYYGPNSNGQNPAILPQILTETVIIDALKGR